MIYALLFYREVNENIIQDISHARMLLYPTKLGGRPASMPIHPVNFPRVILCFIKRRLALQAFYDVGTLIMS
jgi:hypothetical protein